MLRKNHFLFALVMSFSASAFALVGGPFDNGDYSQLLDDQGVYQASFTMTNGLGFAQFGSNVSLGPSISTSGGSGGSTSQTTNSTIGTILNRSVIYYKGLTYFGMATGMVDLEHKTITGITNGTSDVTLNQSSSSNGGNVIFGTSSNVNASTNVITNGGLGYTCNTAWNGVVTESTNDLTFHGDGTLTVLNPDLSSQIFQALSNLIAAIPQAATQNQLTSLSVTGNLNNAFSLTPVGQIVQGINVLLTLNTTSNNIPTTQTILDNSDTVPIHVSGSRKFFLSTR
jgi:hypothetical protein